MDYLRRAVSLAMKAHGETFPNPIVGAVIALNERILGEGYHERAGSPHAEIVALKNAGDARDATLYTTLEPCVHHGLQPPCTDAIVSSGVSRVVIGAMDPNPVTAGQGVNRLLIAGIDVEIRNDPQCLRAIEEFRSWVLLKRPYVALKMASSLDGYISSEGETRQQLTGKRWFRDLQRLRAGFQAVMVGAGTLLVDDPLLTIRKPPLKRRFVRIVVGGRRELPASSRGFTSTAGYQQSILLVPDREAPWLQQLGGSVDVLCAPDNRGGVDVSAGLQMLYEQRDIHTILCEGGPTLAGALLSARAVDRLYWATAPMLLSSEQGVQAIKMLQKGITSVALEFDGVKQRGRDIVLTAAVRYDV